MLGGAWAITEWLRGTMFTGFPWNPAAAVLAPTPLITITPLIGTYGLSASSSCSAAPSGSNITSKWLPLVVILGVTALLWLLPSSPVPARSADGHATLRIVQPNIGQQDKWRPGFDEEAARRLADLVGRPDRRAAAAAVARSRGHRPARGRAHRRASAPMAAVRAHARRLAARAQRPPADRRDRGRLERRRPRRRRRQQHLRARRPADESSAATTRRISFPTANICRCGRCCPRSACRGSRRATSTSPPGPGPRTHLSRRPVGQGRASSSATRSSSPAMSSIGRTGPAFIFNPSNDAWFGRWGPPQHLAQARLRAAEEGIPVLRSTPTGISAVIDARGKVVKSLPLAQRRASSMRCFRRPPTRRRCSPGSATSSRCCSASCCIFGGIVLGRRRR